MTSDGARDWARTRTSDATTPPPPVDQAVREAAVEERVVEERAAEERVVGERVVEERAAGPDGQPAVPPAGAAASSGPQAPAPPGDDDEVPLAVARRPPLVGQGLLAALVGGIVTAAALLGPVPLVLAVVVLQVVLAVAVLALLDVPAAGGAGVVAGVAAVAADAVVLADDGRLDRVTGVVGLALVASLLHQLVRRGRSRVTESLAGTSLAVLLAVAAACLLALPAGDRDEPVLLSALAAVTAALFVGRLADRLLLPRARLAPGSTRTWPGVAVAAVAGTGAALLVAGTRPDDSPAAAALLGLAAVATAVTADLAVDLGGGELRAGPRDARRVRALLPAAVLLPYALVGPVAVLVSALSTA